jgi:DNA-binding response OmpR family regulator
VPGRGASDYVTKPVDLDHLFSVMRVWLARVLERTAESATERP